MRRYFLSEESLAYPPPHIHLLEPIPQHLPLSSPWDPQAMALDPQVPLQQQQIQEAEAQVTVANGQVSWVSGNQTTPSHPTGPGLIDAQVQVLGARLSAASVAHREAQAHATGPCAPPMHLALQVLHSHA